MKRIAGRKSINARFFGPLPLLIVLLLAGGADQPGFVKPPGTPRQRPREVKTEILRRDNGQLRQIQRYYLDRDGKKVLHGFQVDFWSDGAPHEIVAYKDGKRHGVYLSWHPTWGPGDFDLDKHWEGGYKDGKQEGLWRKYHRGDDIAEQCTYKEGKVVGKKLYYAFGVVLGEEVYDKGHLVEKTLWHDNRVKLMHGTYKPARSAGMSPEEVKKMIEEGDSKTVQEYFMPRKHGEWTFWNPNGEVIAHGVWKDGQPWEGVCGVEKLERPITGFFGREVFGRYKQGKLIEEVPRPAFFSWRKEEQKDPKGNSADEHGPRGHK